MKKAISILKSIFSVGLTCCIVYGMLLLLSFLVAMAVGGTFAVTLCALLAGYFIPILYVAGTILAMLGLLKMYLAGEKSFVMERPQKSIEKKQKDDREKS